MTAFSLLEKGRGSRPLSLIAIIARKNQTQIYSQGLMQTIVNAVEMYQIPDSALQFALLAIATLAKGKPNRIPIAAAGGARVVCNAMKIMGMHEDRNVTRRVGNYGMEAIAYISEAEDNVATVLDAGCLHADFKAFLNPSRKFRG